MSGADVVMGLAGFEVFVAVIELNVAGRGGLVGLAVVFDVIGAKTGIPIVNVYVAISGDDVAFAALRLRFQICHSAFGGTQAALLCRGDARSEEHTSELQSLTNLVCRLLLEK